MKKQKDNAILMNLINTLQRQGSWTGETKLQRISYFLKHLMGVPLDFDFILYKHGMFSFGLQTELNILYGYKLLDLETIHPYSPKFVVSDVGEVFLKKFPKTTAKYEKQIDFLVDELGKMAVEGLSSRSIVHYITSKNLTLDQKGRTKKLMELKPFLFELESDTEYLVRLMDEFIAKAVFSISIIRTSAEHISQIV